MRIPEVAEEEKTAVFGADEQILISVGIDIHQSGRGKSTHEDFLQNARLAICAFHGEVCGDVFLDQAPIRHTDRATVFVEVNAAIRFAQQQFRVAVPVQVTEGELAVISRTAVEQQRALLQGPVKLTVPTVSDFFLGRSDRADQA